MSKLLRQALNELYFNDFDSETEEFIEEIISYLDAEPEAEPVANYYAAKYVGDKYERAVTEWLRHPKQDCYLYTRPEPKREPLTDDDMWRVYIKAIEDDHRISGCELFILGVRFAEKHHGISPRCENS